MSQTELNVERITVFVVDDHDVVRKGLRFYLSAHPDIAIVGEAGDAQSAVEGVAEHVPDVVLMDLVLPLQPGTEPTDQGGVQATRRIRQISPHSQVVVLTSFAQDELIFSAIKAGALSYLLKDADAETVLNAIYAASRGEVILHPRIAQRLMAEATAPTMSRDPITRLTVREMEVLRLIAQGLTNAEIAAELVITERTVKAHVGNLLGKLHLSDRTQAAIYAWREGLMK
ncbi:MAG: response regulator transcription factor [Anaerolineae bacterium]|jgi:NarL family two-component system response regulator LiaR|nr:response regulator transcription factor [Anaerolineae bacterium]MDH7473364.1 response regulator transcription factor [Anaerolineae bacterium]